jgi:hypothetical protein
MWKWARYCGPFGTLGQYSGRQREAPWNDRRSEAHTLSSNHCAGCWNFGIVDYEPHINGRRENQVELLSQRMQEHQELRFLLVRECLILQLGAFGLAAVAKDRVLDRQSRPVVEHLGLGPEPP